MNNEAARRPPEPPEGHHDAVVYRLPFGGRWRRARLAGACLVIALSLLAAGLFSPFFLLLMPPAAVVVLRALADERERRRRLADLRERLRRRSA